MVARWARSFASKGMETGGENRPFFASLLSSTAYRLNTPPFCKPVFRQWSVNPRSLSCTVGQPSVRQERWLVRRELSATVRNFSGDFRLAAAGPILSQTSVAHRNSSGVRRDLKAHLLPTVDGRLRIRRSYPQFSPSLVCSSTPSNCCARSVHSQSCGRNSVDA